MVEYPLPAFDGGKNNKYEPYIIADNESPDCLNSYSNDLGGVRTRFGSQKLNTAAVGSFTNHGLFTLRYDSGNATMVGWWNGSMYALSGTTFNTIPSAASVYTAGQYVCQVMYQDIAFFGNGYSPNYKYNGAEFTRMGIPQPNSFPATSGTSAGTLTGSYQYKVSYINSYAVEGDVSSNTTTITYVSQVGGLTSIPVAPTSFGVVARRIYRKDVTSGTTFLLLTEIANNTTTTYADNTPNADLGAQAPADQGEPPPYEFAVVHKERIFFKKPGDPLIYYSELGTPFVVKVLNFRKVGDGVGEITRGLGVHADSVVCYRDTGSIMIYMEDTDPTNWAEIKTNANYGSSSHFSICDYGDYQMSLGKSLEGAVNFAALRGASAAPSVTQLNVTNIVSNSKSDKIEPDIRTFAPGQLSKVFGIRFDNRLWYAVPYGINATANTRVYVFDYFQRDKERNDGAWWPMTFPYNFTYFTIHNGDLYGAVSNATGFVYKLNVADLYSDDGSAINSYFYTREYEGYKGQNEHHKDFRRLNLTLGTLGDWNVGISYILDADATGSGDLQQVNTSPGGSLWGSMTWGSNSWGGGSTRKLYKLELATANGLKVQFKFDNRNTAGRAFEVLRGTFFYNDRGRR